jgi:putative hydrolase of the HAD superfamily
MIPANVRVIALDAAGTIIAPAPEVHVVYCDVAKSHGYELDAERIRSRFAPAMQAYFPLAWDPATAQTDEDKQWHAWKSLVATVLPEIPPLALEPVFRDLWNHFRKSESWFVYHDVEPTISRLKEIGLQVVVASNFDKRLHDLRAGHSGLRHVDHWFASVDVGFQKPCGDFYREIEKRLGVDPPTLLMVGDSWVADYQGAAKAGWHALYLNRSLKNGMELPPQTIRSLQQLLPDK